MGRTSHEVRGLKYLVYAVRDLEPASHLTRGAWIEMKENWGAKEYMDCRTSHEVRGLK